MFDLVESNTLILIALLGGCICAISSSIIDDLFTTFIMKKSSMNIKRIATKSTFYALTLGLLFSVVFYAFAAQETEPIKMIFIFTFCFGFIVPILSKLLVFLLPGFSQD